MLLNLDAATMADKLEILELAKDYNPNLDIQVLLTHVDLRTKDTKEMFYFLN